jgi:gluconolactonase
MKRIILNFLFLLSFAVTAQAADKWTPPHDLAVQPYPYPGMKVLDESFRKYVITIADVERLGSGFRWAEGPVWFGDGRYLLFSDLPNNRIMRWDEETSQVSIYRKPSNYTNGMTRDLHGRLIACEHGRRVTRTEYDGSITVLADSYNGKPLNSPNDVIVKSDGSIWFTDLAGKGSDYHHPSYLHKPELPHSIYRIDQNTNKLVLLTTEVNGPNGLGFSPDESVFYVTGILGGKQGIVAFEVTENGTRLGKSRMLAIVENGYADGFAVDKDGNIWLGLAGTADDNGVAVYNSKGKMIGFIHMPEGVGNICFGGEKNNRLFMAAGKSLYSLFVETRGSAPLFKK